MKLKVIAILLVIICTNPFSNDARAQWAQAAGTVGKNVHAFFSDSSMFFAGTTSGILRSTDKGLSWNSGGLADTSVVCFVKNEGAVFAGLQTGGGVFKSTNNGENWEKSGLQNSAVVSLTCYGRYLLAGIAGTNVQWSTDNGGSWFYLPNSPASVNAFLPTGPKLFAGASGLFCSADSGQSWTASDTALASSQVTCLAADGSNLFVGSFKGVHLSTDSGLSWTPVNNGLTNIYVYSIAVDGTNIFAGTNGGGVFVSTNKGASWSAVNSGLTNLRVLALGVNGTSLFAGPLGGGVWKRPLAEMTTSVQPLTIELPSAFSVCQNYPNPFNPSTTIKYELPVSSTVRLGVYDILGREVLMLVNERMNAGVHDVKFDASGLSSGVYFYRLQAGDFTQTRKFLLLQ